jgi:hypothetical protein
MKGGIVRLITDPHDGERKRNRGKQGRIKENKADNKYSSGHKKKYYRL